MSKKVYKMCPFCPLFWCKTVWKTAAIARAQFTPKRKTAVLHSLDWLIISPPFQKGNRYYNSSVKGIQAPRPLSLCRRARARSWASIRPRSGACPPRWASPRWRGALDAAVEKEPSFERRLDYDISQSHKRKT